jgi:CheY-like chemotaxis protein
VTQPPKLLVINSSPDTIEMLVAYFSHHGWEAHGASAHRARHGGANLVDVVGEVAPDVIVFDVAIPYEDYWRVCQGLRQDPRIHVPIVLTTTNVLALRRLVATTEHVLEIIGKPYDLQQVLRAVHHAYGDDRFSPPQDAAETADRERRHAERRVGDRRNREDGESREGREQRRPLQQTS